MNASSAWLTAAELVLSLIEAPAWRAADPRHVDVFARANVVMWDQALEANPGWPRDWQRQGPRVGRASG